MSIIESQIRICLLYPDLLGTYGDNGNAVILQKRLHWRGIEAQIIPISTGEPVPESCDIYVMGGGEDQPQTSVTNYLGESKALHRAVANNAAVLAICAGMQILGESFAVAGGKTKNGLGLLDIKTVRGEGPRKVGELTVEPTLFFTEKLTGYENHGGSTIIGENAVPLGKVVKGKGNDGNGYDGATNGRIIGTYMHGPVLARNAHLADLLLEWVVGEKLQPINDTAINDLRTERLSN